MTAISETLKQRDARYGAYVEQARVTQNIKLSMSQSANWKLLAPDQREALEMIAVKVSRILTGDPNFTDSWHDIQGYAKLVEDRLVIDGLAGK